MLPARPLQTFISYSRVNQQFALRLACELKSAGFSVWMDQFDIPTGSRWDDEIEKALRGCEIFVFIMTPASIASENAKDEVGYAIDHGKHILPVLLEKCEVPLRLRRMQYVDFTAMTFNEGIQRAKELLSNLVCEIEESKSGDSHHTGAVAAQQHATLAGNEPKTTPTSRRSISSASMPKTGKRKSRFYAIGAGGILLVGALILIPYFFGLLPFASVPFPSPTSTIAPSETASIAVSPLPSNTTIAPTLDLELMRTFTEEFDSDALWRKNWELVYRHSNQEKKNAFKQEISNGNFILRLNHEFIWNYFLYKPVTDYNNVELEVTVADLEEGETFGIVCHYTDRGWYEFDIAGGKFNVRYVDSMESNRDEESFVLHYGFIPGFKDSYTTPRDNVIRVTCQGKNLSLSVNNVTLMKDFSKKPELDRGQIGILFRSYQKYPVDIEVKSIKVNVP